MLGVTRLKSRHGTPIPNKSIEKSSSGSGPVITYKLSDEELKALGKLTPDCGLTKAELLKELAEGQSIASIERSRGMKTNTLYYWVDKWGLSGVTQKQARLLTGGSQPQTPPETVPDPPEVALAPPADIVIQPEEFAKGPLVMPIAEHDPVQNPSHYTAGGIETIDYLQAKLSPEEYAGYCRGNVLKYVSRAGMKGSPLEDFEKAQVYLGRLIKAKAGSAVND